MLIFQRIGHKGECRSASQCILDFGEVPNARQRRPLVRHKIADNHVGIAHLGIFPKRRGHVFDITDNGGIGCKAAVARRNDRTASGCGVCGVFTRVDIASDYRDARFAPMLVTTGKIVG